MRILFLLIASLVLLISCSTEAKEKELPSYFCNENLERYFAGNDSLPIININPNDSFGVIRESVDSLYRISDFPDFKLPISIDSNHKSSLIKSFLLFYSPFKKLPMNCFDKRYILEIRLNSAAQLLADGELSDTQMVRELIVKNLSNLGEDPNYSQDPKYFITSFKWDKGVKPKFYKNTLKAIINGYIDGLKYVSQNSYGKPLCELNTNEFDLLSQNIPFRLSLGYPDTRPHYPPPPIIKDEFLSE